MERLQEALNNLSTSPLLPKPDPILIIVSGPSGVGKDAVIKQLQVEKPNLHFVVTATSRAVRPGEKHGVDYLFVSREQFEQWIREDALIEHAVVYEEYKGIPREQVTGALAKGTDVVLRIDVQGAATMKKLFPEAVTIFLVAESESELGQRLVDRKTEPPEKLVIRLQTAKQELAKAPSFDYVVVNKGGQLEQTVQKLSNIIDAEKSRSRCLHFEKQS